MEFGYDIDSTKSLSDKKHYRLINLKNGLRALLVHDPKSIDENEEEESDDASYDGSEDSTRKESMESTSNSSGQGDSSGKTKKAACALVVGVGSFCDSDCCQGLAHYLEHMLFMGSRKYPGENEYDSFISKHGGSTNAFTECEYTLYHFDILPSYFEKALDIFAQFFIDPLMDQDSSDRELNSIESEFNLSKNSDYNRIQEIRCYDAPLFHPYRTFTFGNLESLKYEPEKAGVNVREELWRFYSNLYSASLMQLVVQSELPLDLMEEIIFHTFQNIPNRNVDVTLLKTGICPEIKEFQDSKRNSKFISFENAGFPLPVHNSPMLYCICPVKDIHKLILAWNFPPQQKYYRSQPTNYVGHLVGHEGKGSLMSLLRRKQMATGLTAGIHDSGHSCGTYGAVFEIEVDLTWKGVQHWYSVTEDIFHYLSLIRNKGIHEWIHEELHLISQIKYRFQEEEDPVDFVTELATRMLPANGYKEKHFLEGPFLFDEWNSEYVKQIMDLLNPDTARFELVSSLFKSIKLSNSIIDVEINNCEDKHLQRNNCNKQQLSSIKKNWPFSTVLHESPKVEPRFGAEYWVHSIPVDYLNDWILNFNKSSIFFENIDENDKNNFISIPEKNFLIPTDFTLRNECHFSYVSTLKHLTGYCLEGLKAPTNHSPIPSVVLKKNGLKVWHLCDTKFKQPRAEIFLKISFNDVSDIVDIVFFPMILDLCVKVITEELAEFSYVASMAEIHYRLKSSPYGFEVHFWGFNHQILELLKHVVSGILRLRCFDFPSSQSFETQKENLLRIYANADMKPDKQVSSTRLALLFNKFFLDEEKYNALKEFKLTEFQNFIKNSLFCSTLEYEMFIHGNINQDEAVAIGNHILKIDGIQAGAVVHTDRRVRRIPNNMHLLYCTLSRDPSQKNSAVETYWQLGEDNIKARIHLDILEYLMEEPLYDSLRTQQQLAYAVSCGCRMTGGVLGYYLKITSASHSPSVLMQRIDKFLHEFTQYIEDLSPEVFREHVRSLAQNKLEPDNSLGEEAQKHWHKILNRTYDFNAFLHEVDEMQYVSKEDIVNLIKEKIDPKSVSPRLTVIILGKSIDVSNELLKVSDEKTKVMETLAFERTTADYYPVLVGDS